MDVNVALTIEAKDVPEWSGPSSPRFTMLAHVTEVTRRRIGNTILTGLALCLIAAIWGTVLKVRESMERGREDVRKTGLLIAQALDHAKIGGRDRGQIE